VQGRGAGGLVAREVGHHPTGGRHAEVGAQPLEAAGVLRGDHVGAGQLLGEPRRGVADPADRGGGEHEQAGGFGVHGPIIAGT
jgi:hypothetical protein